MKSIAKVWKFASSSGSNTYETLQYIDNSTSCNCPGWTRRVAADGSRTCKHTRTVDMGQADSDCISSHDYNLTVKPLPVKAPQRALPDAKKIKMPKVKVELEQVAPARRVLWK